MRIPPYSTDQTRPSATIIPDSARCRPFRTPAKKVEVPFKQPPSLSLKKQKSSNGFLSFNFFSDSSSGPLSAWDYLGIKVISAVSALAIAAITGLIAAPCCREETIAQKELSYWDKRQIQLNPLYQENLFDKHSSIYQAISLYADQLNIRTTCTYLNWIPSLMGFTKPDTLVVSRKSRPEIELTCTTTSNAISCYLSQGLIHKEGHFSYHYREDLSPYVNHNEEILSFQPDWNPYLKTTITAKYSLNHDQQIGDFFSNFLSGQYDCCKDREGLYHFPTKFQEHSEAHPSNYLLEPTLLLNL